jgi:hypothetical protein
MVHPLLQVQATRRYEKRAAPEPEFFPNDRSRQWTKRLLVDAVGNDVPERRLEQGSASRVLEFFPRGNHPYARTKAVTLTVLHALGEEPQEALGFADSHARVPRLSSSQARTGERDAVAVKLHDEWQALVDALANELDRTRRLAVNQIERALAVESHERLVRALEPRRIAAR